MDAAHLQVDGDAQRRLRPFPAEGVPALAPSSFFAGNADAVGRRNRLSRQASPRLCNRECAALAARLSLRRATARCVDSIVEPGGLSLYTISTRSPDGAVHLMENGDNRASILDAEDPPQGKYRAQWNDDYHHAWRVLMTGEKQLLRRLQQAPISDIARSLASELSCIEKLVGLRRQARPRRPSGPDGLHQLRKTTTRSAIARSATGLKARLIYALSRRGLPCCCCRLYPCCSWAKDGARKRPSRSSAISAVISRTPSEGPPCRTGLGLRGVWRRQFRDVARCFASRRHRAHWDGRHAPPRGSG